MNYSIDKVNDISILKIADHKMVFESIEPTQEEIVKEIVDNNVKRLIIDFAEVEYMDSFAVGFVMEMYRRVSNIEGKVAICNLQARVKKILFITRVNNVVDVFDSLEEATASIA